MVVKKNQKVEEQKQKSKYKENEANKQLSASPLS